MYRLHRKGDNIKKFIVDKVQLTEKDVFKFFGIFDENNKDWYGEQKNFKSDTLKVMYNKDTLRVAGTNQDVSMIAPTTAGDVVEEIEYQEVQVNPNLYFVDGKLIELKACETIKNGKVVFNRDLKIEHAKKELVNLKIEHSEKEFLFKEKYYQKNRDLDKNNLTSIVVMLNATKQTHFRDWKFKDKDGNDVYADLSLQDMMSLANKMQQQTTKSMKIESELISKLENLTDEELKLFNAREEFEKLWN